MADMVTLDTYRELENRKNKQIEELERKLEKEIDHRIHNFNKAIEWKEKHRALKKEIAKLKSKNCWKTCEYAEPKSQWIGQHIQDVVQLTKAKNILKYVLNSFVGDLPKNLSYFDEEELKAIVEAEQFLQEVNQDLNEGFDLDKTAEDEGNIQSSLLTGTAIKSEPRKWKGWKDKDYIPGKMIVYNKDIFKNEFSDIKIIALENVRNLDGLNKTEKFAVAIAGNKYFVTHPDYQHMIEDIIPVDDGLKVIIEDKKYKKNLKNFIFLYGVYGDKEDPISWEYVEIPFKFEVKKERNY